MRRSCFLSPPAVMGALVLVGLLAAPPAAFAQYQGHNFKGDFGVNSGTQPPPGLFVGIPYLQWGVDDITDNDGNEVLAGQFQGFDMRMIPLTVIAVTPYKVLGANYGAMVALSFSKLRPERAGQNVGDGSWGFTDTYVVPLYLGWHTPRADVVAGYGFFAPTGTYEVGGSDNTGLGMWSHEFQGGATVYLDSARRISAATTAYVEFHSKKKDQDLKVGRLATFEGGVAYNVPKIAGAFGLAYYAQKKLSDDTGADIPVGALRALNLYGRNQVFGIGPDVTMGVFQKGATAGLINVRYLQDFGAKSSFSGSTFALTFTIAKMRPAS